MKKMKRKFSHLTNEEMKYVLSEIPSNLLENYHITYCKYMFNFKPDKNGTKINGRLESRFGENSFDEIIRKIELESLKNLGRMSSQIVESYNRNLDEPKEVTVQRKKDGGLVFKFGK